jgi:CheY-like chemotaxis protein
LFLDLALRFYYGKTDIGQTIDNPGATPTTPVQTCNYWKWDSDKGLVRTQVPAVIFNDLMTQRACERALTLKADMADAVSLWLDANNRREAEVPAGTTDPVRGDQASAHFYNVSSGARHLDDALARALNDRDAVVALKLTHSLGLIVGSSTLSGRPGDPLTDALRFPDKRVRYEAACALATALPAKPFAGQELVVPLLVHAIGEGGGGNIVVLGASQDEANTAQDALRKLGYVTATAASPGEAIVAAGTLPSVDAVVIARGTSDESIARTLALSAQSPQLVGVPQVVMAEASTGFAAAQSITNPLVSVTTEAGGDKLKAAVEAGRQKAGLSQLDQKETDAYAMRAATALGNLAIGDNQILGVAGAETGLLSALNGPRDELVSAVGSVLARLTSATAQQGLARRALDESAPGPVRIALFQSLTVSAKAFGNQLDDAQVKVLEKQAVDTKDADIRSAAAEARGALNLPTDQATQLILGQTGN